MRLAETIKATVKCPKCGKLHILKIPLDVFDSNAEGGLLKIAMGHGDHVFVAFIDRNGMQRATDTLTLIGGESRGEERDEVSKILSYMNTVLEIFEEDVLARIIAASIIGLRIYFAGETDVTRPLYHTLTYLLQEFPPIVTNIDEADVVPDAKDSKVPGEKYFSNAIEEAKNTEREDQRILKLKRHVEKIFEISTLVTKKLKASKTPISIVRLQKELDIKDQDLFGLALRRAIYKEPELANKIKEKHYLI